MKVMKLSVFVFVILAAVFVSCWGGDTDVEAAVLPKPAFQNFLLALTWPNQFCATQTCDPRIPTQQNYFTIHGLWPRNTPAGSENGCDTTINFDKKDLVPMKADLLKYWPALRNAADFDKSVGFWRYEWTTHGTCSSNKYGLKEYFQKAIDLAKKYSAAIYEALEKKGVKPDAQKQYRESDIFCAIREVTGFEASLSRNGQALAEIRLCVRDDAVTLYDCYVGNKLTFAAAPAPPPPPPPPRSLSQSPNSARWEVSSVLEAVDDAV